VIPTSGAGSPNAGGSPGEGNCAEAARHRAQAKRIERIPGNGIFAARRAG